MFLFYCYAGPPALKCDYEQLRGALYDRLEGNTSEPFDHLTHFLLCVMVVSAPHLKREIFRLEKNLFICRLSKIYSESLKKHLKCLYSSLFLDSVQRGVQGRSKMRLGLIKNVLEKLLARVDHAFAPNHSIECRHSKLLLPFTFPRAMVAQRKVELCSGKAQVPCGLWRILLEDLFDHLLEIEVDILSRSKHVLKAINRGEDDRIRRLLESCSIHFGGQSDSIDRGLSCLDIDKESKYFPPCMANLHQILRKTHRLSYDSRYQYTLFLKDSGLSLDENMSFWSKEYSQPYEGSSCQHHWKEKELRYKYQIKHMYGMIGDANVKYSRPCDEFIDKLSSKMNGGCPFKHLTIEELRAELPRPLLSAADSVFDLYTQGQPRRACANYLALQKPIRNLQEIHRPIQYYRLARGTKRYFSATF